MTQEESDDYILIDGDGSVGNLDAWGTIWYAFSTDSLKRPPMDFQVLNSSETKVTFQWRKDQCVKLGYSLIYNSFNGKQVPPETARGNRENQTFQLKFGFVFFFTSFGL